MLQRALILLAQVKTGSSSENLLLKIRRSFSSFYREKQITKKIYSSQYKDEHDVLEFREQQDL